MQEKIHLYESDEIKVTYDSKRCIHAAECVRRLPDVFDTSNRPWIQPENSRAEQIADVIEKCPTGSLRYEMKLNGRSESPSSRNRVMLRPNGPIYFFGDIEVQDHEGNTLLRDTRFAFCRCGASGNKPACDNSHQEIKWEAGTDADKSKMPEIEKEEHDKLIIKLMKDGPAILDGSYTIESSSIGEHTSNKGIALCRCGASSTKPYCDGTHKGIGFKGDN